VPLGALLDRWAQRSGAADALVSADERVSYAELAERSERLARHLRGLGIASGDRVVVQLPNRIEFAYMLFALVRLGALPVLALPPHREHEISYLIDHADAVAYVGPQVLGRFDYLAMARGLQPSRPALAHVLSDADVRDLLARPAPDGEPLPAPNAGEPALFLLSGGTTGLPKLIPRTHDDYACFFGQAADLCRVGPETVYMVALPIAHNFPLAAPGMLGALSRGGKVVIAPDPSPESTFPLIERERVTMVGLVPLVAMRWADSPLRAECDLSSLNWMTVGGSRLSAEGARRIMPAFKCQLQQALGMAEGLFAATRAGDPDEVLVETQGRPMMEADEIRVVDELGQPVPEGALGELETRGPYTIRGYYRADAHNRTAFTADGFYRTGDLVRLHPSGNLCVEGRRKDLINRGGEKISAEEVENLILSHPSVDSVAVVAMPDPEFGERTCAYVVLHEGKTLSLEIVRTHFDLLNVARFKCPERIELVPSLPLTSVGKVNKKALRADIKAKLLSEGLIAATAS
jgi:2,3-dihydroxybenzoate-AMP ligase